MFPRLYVGKTYRKAGGKAWKGRSWERHAAAIERSLPIVEMPLLPKVRTHYMDGKRRILIVRFVVGSRISVWDGRQVGRRDRWEGVTGEEKSAAAIEIS